MLRDKIRAAWAMPRVPDPPARVWRDGVLVVVAIVVAVVEVAIRSDLVWRPLSFALVLIVAPPTLLWRRTHTLATTLGVFGLISTVEVASLAAGAGWEGMYSMGWVLLLVYALGRWGSGREIAAGLLAVFVSTTLGIIADDPLVIGDLIGGILIVFATVEIGIIVRSQARSHAQALEQTRMQERAELARELHDTVAHHVSAIAIQAQAGRALAAAKPEEANGAALDALAVIEEEASRTLAEMRSMVSALRQSDQPAYAPQPGVADIRQLAGSDGEIRIDVELRGDLDQLRPSIDSALFRLANEAVTNAVRHARNASRVAVTVDGGEDAVRLTVHDDGDGGGAGAGQRSGADEASSTGLGFGLVGMRERAKLLGGTLEAGPTPGRGWSVDAVLPREGAAS